MIERVTTNWQTSLVGLVVLIPAIVENVLGIDVPGFQMDLGTAIAIAFGFGAAGDAKVK